MTLNVEKCFVVSFGSSNFQRSYRINGLSIPYKEVFSDLGVSISPPISFKPHIENIVAQAFKKLAIINKVFKIKNQYIIMKLYKSFVRPTLEYASIIWSPYTQYLIDDIERVQKRVCNMIPSFRAFSYREQLSSLGLLSLEARRSRYQLITIFKMYKGFSDLDFRDFFELITNSATRGHSARIRAKSSNRNYRLNFFTVSSIFLWNQLSQSDVDSPSLHSFKSNIQAFFLKSGIW